MIPTYLLFIWYLSISFPIFIFFLSWILSFFFVKLTVRLWAGGWVCRHPVLTGLNLNPYTNEHESHTHTHTQNPDSHDQHSTAFPFQSHHSTRTLPKTIPPSPYQHNLSASLSSDIFLTFRVSFSQSFLKFSLCLFAFFVTPPCFISHMSLRNDKKVLLKIVLAEGAHDRKV